MTRRMFLSLLGIGALALLLALVFRHGIPILASVQDGIGAVGGIELPKIGSTGSVRHKIVTVINFLLSFLALIAVIAIIVAGFIFIFGAGSENSVQRAKKIILYTIIGLVVIFFARVIVGFFVQELPSL